MNTKTIKFDLNKFKLYEKIKAKQGDTKSRFLLFQLLDGSAPFNLKNRSVRAYMIKPDGKEIFNDLIVNNYNLGYCTLELTNQVLAVTGTVKIELMVTEEEKKLTSSVFELEVVKSINSEKSIVSTNEFTALLNGLASLSEYDNYKNSVKSMEVNKADKAKVEEKFGEVYEQLDNKANESDLLVERNRIDNIVTLPPSVDNAETADIRIDADGNKHASAGEATRTIHKRTLTKYKNLIKNGDFSKDVDFTSGVTNWTTVNGTVSKVDGVCKFLSTTQNQSIGQKVQTISGHWYLVKANIKCVDSTNTVIMAFLGQNTKLASSEFKDYTFIARATDTSEKTFIIQDTASSIRHEIFIKNAVILDLTEVLGVGNETLENGVNFLSKFNGYIAEDSVNLNDAITYFENLINDSKPTINFKADYYSPVVQIPDYNMDNFRVNNLYTMWDTLISQHPSYLKKEILGKDQSNTYDIWKISFKSKSPKLKILLVANVHGHNSDTRDASIALYYFIYDICKNWRTNEQLYWLHEHAEIIFIPCGNPWGYNSGSRLNSRGVNINRNFSIGRPSSTTEEYGESAFSEIETQYIRDMILNNKDASGFIDLHCYGTTGTNNFLEYVGLYVDEKSVAYKVLNDVENYYVDKYNGKAITYNNVVGGGTSLLYAENGCGVDGGLLEFAPYVKDYIAHSSEMLTKHTEWYGSVIYKWLKDYHLLKNFILAENGNKYKLTINSSGNIEPIKIN